MIPLCPRRLFGDAAGSPNALQQGAQLGLLLLVQPLEDCVLDGGHDGLKLHQGLTEGWMNTRSSWVGGLSI